MGSRDPFLGKAGRRRYRRNQTGYAAVGGRAAHRYANNGAAPEPAFRASGSPIDTMVTASSPRWWSHSACCLAPSTCGRRMGDDRPPDLAFLAEQQQRLLADQHLMLDELHVQGPSSTASTTAKPASTRRCTYGSTSCARSIGRQNDTNPSRCGAAALGPLAAAQDPSDRTSSSLTCHCRKTPHSPVQTRLVCGPISHQPSSFTPATPRAARRKRLGPVVIARRLCIGRASVYRHSPPALGAYSGILLPARPDPRSGPGQVLR